jgi:hopanoid biosynthesis associated protein HpnK
LIVNADDFGLTPGVNRAIIEAHRQGIATSATLMANGSAFDDAVHAAQSTSQLSIGCHVVLVDGTPISDPSRAPTLVTTQGSFRDSLNIFALRAMSSAINPSEIEAEAIAQIRKLQTAGVTVSHIDTHKHTHMIPRVLRPLLSAARTCGIRAIRNPFGVLHFSSLLGRPGLWKQYGKVAFLNRFGKSFRKNVAQAGLVTPDGTLGIVATGSLDDRLFANILDTVPDGTWELVCHPGYNDADLDRVRTRLRDSRAVELRLLTFPGIHETLTQRGIQLISYRDLT